MGGALATDVCSASKRASVAIRFNSALYAAFASASVATMTAGIRFAGYTEYSARALRIRVTIDCKFSNVDTADLST